MSKLFELLEFVMPLVLTVLFTYLIYIAAQ